MNQDLLPLVAAVPAVMGLLSVGARALLAAGNGAVAARVHSAVPSYEAALDWAVHFSVGAMVLGIGTALFVELASAPNPLIGLFTGLFAAALAFVMARPPVREDAPNPEMDGRSFGLSAFAHVLLGVGLSSLLIASS